MPKPLENWDQTGEYIMPVSVENRFQKAVRNVFGIGPDQLKGVSMTKIPQPTPAPDTTPRKKAKVVPQIMTAAMRG